MVILNIKLKDQQSALDFLRIVSKYSFDVDAHFGRCVLDAKSVLGMLGISIGKPIQIYAHTDEKERLERELKAFEVENENR